MLSLDVEKETGKKFNNSRLHSELHPPLVKLTSVVYSFSKEYANP